MSNNSDNIVPATGENYVSSALISAADNCIENVNTYKPGKFIVQSSEILNPRKSADKNVAVSQNNHIKHSVTIVQELCVTPNVEVHDKRKGSIYISLDKINILNRENQIKNGEQDSIIADTARTSVTDGNNSAKVIVFSTGKNQTSDLFRRENENLNLEHTSSKPEDSTVESFCKELQPSSTGNDKQLIIENAALPYNTTKSESDSQIIGAQMIVKPDKFSKCSLQVKSLTGNEKVGSVQNSDGIKENAVVRQRKRVSEVYKPVVGLKHFSIEQKLQPPTNIKKSPVRKGITPSMTKVNAINTDQNTILLTRTKPLVASVQVLNSRMLKKTDLPSVKQLLEVSNNTNSGAEKCFTLSSSSQSAATCEINHNNLISKIIVVVPPTSNWGVPSADSKKEENSLIVSQNDLSRKPEFYQVPAKITKLQETNKDAPKLLPTYRDIIKVTKIPGEHEVSQFDGKIYKTHRGCKKPKQSIISTSENLSNGISLKVVNSADELTSMYKRLSEVVPAIAQPVELTRISVPQIQEKNAVCLKSLNEPFRTQINNITSFRKGSQKTETICIGNKSVEDETIFDLKSKPEFMASQTFSVAVSSSEMVNNNSSVPSVLHLKRLCEQDSGMVLSDSEIPLTYQVQETKETSNPYNILKDMLRRGRDSQVNKYKDIKKMEGESDVQNKQRHSQQLKLKEGNSLKMIKTENMLHCKINSSEQRGIATLDVVNTIKTMENSVMTDLLASPVISMNAADGMLDYHEHINKMVNYSENVIGKRKIGDKLQPIPLPSEKLQKKGNNHILDPSIPLYAEKDCNVKLFSVPDKMLSGNNGNCMSSLLMENAEEQLDSRSLRSFVIRNDHNKKWPQFEEVQIRLNKSPSDDTTPASDEIKKFGHEENGTSEENILVDLKHATIPPEIIVHSGIDNIGASGSNSVINSAMMMEYVVDKDDHRNPMTHQLIGDSELGSFSSENLKLREVALHSVDSVKNKHDHQGDLFLSCETKGVLQSQQRPTSVPATCGMSTVYTMSMPIENLENLVTSSKRVENFPALLPSDGHVSIAVEPHATTVPKVMDCEIKVLKPHLDNENSIQSYLPLIPGDVEVNNMLEFQEDAEKLSSNLFKLPSISYFTSATKKSCEMDVMVIHEDQRVQGSFKESKSHTLEENEKHLLKSNSAYDSHLMTKAYMIQDSTLKHPETGSKYMQITDNSELLRYEMNTGNEKHHCIQKESMKSLSDIQRKNCDIESCTSSASVEAMTEVNQLETKHKSVETERCNKKSAIEEGASPDKHNFYFTTVKELKAEANTYKIVGYGKDEHNSHLTDINKSKTETNTTDCKAHGKEHKDEHREAFTVDISNNPSSFERRQQLDDLQVRESSLSSDLSQLDKKSHSIDNNELINDAIQRQREINLYVISSDTCKKILDKHVDLNDDNISTKFKKSQNSHYLIERSEILDKTEDKVVNSQMSDSSSTQVKLQELRGDSDVEIPHSLSKISLQHTVPISQNKSDFGKIEIENKSKIVKNPESVAKEEHHAAIYMDKVNIMNIETVYSDSTSLVDMDRKYTMKMPKEKIVSEESTKFNLDKVITGDNTVTSDDNVQVSKVSYQGIMDTIEQVPQNRNQEYGHSSKQNCENTVTLSVICIDGIEKEKIKIPSLTDNVEKYMHPIPENQACLEDLQSYNMPKISVNSTVIKKVFTLDKSHSFESTLAEWIKITGERNRYKDTKNKETCFTDNTTKINMVDGNYCNFRADETKSLGRHMNENESNENYSENRAILQNDVLLYASNMFSKSRNVEEACCETYETSITESRKYNEITILDKKHLNRFTKSCIDKVSEMVSVENNDIKAKTTEKTKKRVDRRKQSLEELRLPEDFMRVEVLSTTEANFIETGDKVRKTYKQQKSLIGTRKHDSKVQKRKSIKTTKTLSSDTISLKDSRVQKKSLSVNSISMSTSKKPENFVHNNLQFLEISENVNGGDMKKKTVKATEDIKDDIIINVSEKVTNTKISGTMTKVLKKDTTTTNVKKISCMQHTQRSVNQTQFNSLKLAKSSSPKKSVVRAFMNAVETNKGKDNDAKIMLGISHSDTKKSADLTKENENQEEKLKNKNTCCTVNKQLWQKGNLTFQKRRMSNRLNPIIGKREIGKTRKASTGASTSSLMLQKSRNSYKESEKVQMDGKINMQNKSKASLGLRKKPLMTSRVYLQGKSARTVKRRSSVSNQLEMNLCQKIKSLQNAAFLKKSPETDSLLSKRKVSEEKDKFIASQKKQTLKNKTYLQLNNVQAEEVNILKPERRFFLRNRPVIGVSTKCNLPNSRVVSNLRKKTEIAKKHKELIKQKKWNENNMQGKLNTRSQKEKIKRNNEHTLSNKGFQKVTVYSRKSELEGPKNQHCKNKKKRSQDAIESKNSSVIVKDLQSVAKKKTKLSSVPYSNLEEMSSRKLRNRSIKMVHLNSPTGYLVKKPDKVATVNVSISAPIKPDCSCKTQSFEDSMFNAETAKRDLISVDMNTVKTGAVDDNDELATVNLLSGNLKLSNPEFECLDLPNTTLVPFVNSNLNITPKERVTSESPLVLADAFEEISEFGEKNEAVKVTQLTEQDLCYSAETTRSLLVLEPSYGSSDINKLAKQSTSELVFEPHMDLPDIDFGSIPESKWPLNAKEKKCYSGKKKREIADFDEDVVDNETVQQLIKERVVNICTPSSSKKCYPGKRRGIDTKLKMVNKNFVIESSQQEEVYNMKQKLLETLASTYDIDLERHSDSQVLQTYSEFKASKSGKSTLPFNLKLRQSSEKCMEYADGISILRNKGFSCDVQTSIMTNSVEALNKSEKKMGELDTEVRRSSQPYHIPPHLLGRSINDPTSDVTERSRPMQRPRMGVKVPYRNLTSQIVTSKEIVKELLERSRARNTAIAMMMNKKVADCVGKTFSKPLSSSLARTATVKDENLSSSNKKIVMKPISKTLVMDKELERAIALRQLAELPSQKRKRKDDGESCSVSKKPNHGKLNVKKTNSRAVRSETVKTVNNKQSKTKKKKKK